jgi:tetratricopeptide (TPR) repeat protein
MSNAPVDEQPKEQPDEQPNEQLEELLELDQWLSATRARAEQLLPHLLGLSISELGPELERHPELRLAILRLLLSAAERMREGYPDRAHALTGMVVEHAGVLVPPLRGDLRVEGTAAIVRDLQAQAWSAHAGSLRRLGRHAEARHAIGVALAIYRQGLVSACHIATAEVIEAQILYDQGERGEALQRIRRAADELLLHGERAAYVEARMAEAAMQWNAGHRKAATAVWVATAQLAEERSDGVLLALLEYRVGLFALQQVNAAEAMRHFERALQVFDAGGMRREATEARRNLARAASACGRFHEAISEYYKVRSMLLADGAVADCTPIVLEILDLMLRTNRHAEILPLAEHMFDTYGATNLPINVLEAWGYVRVCARENDLTARDIETFRLYLRILAAHPSTPFIALIDPLWRP